MDASFEQLKESFVRSLAARNLASNTLANHRTDLGCFTDFLTTALKSPPQIADLSPRHIEHFAHYLEKRYPSDNSRRRRIGSLRSFFDFLVAQDIFPANPVRSLPSFPKFLDVPRPTKPRQVEKIWKHLLRECRKNQPPLPAALAHRNAILFLLIYGGGLKVSSLKTLPASHVRSGRHPRLLLSSPKGDPYSIPLPRPFSSALACYRKALARLPGGTDLPELLFNANPYGILSGGLTPRGIEMIFAELAKS